MASLTILRVAEARSFDDDSEHLWPYLARTLVNLMADGYKRAARDDAVVVRLPASKQLWPEEEVLDRAEARQVVQRLNAIAGPRATRMVIDYVVYGLTWEQLGQRHGISASAARKQVGRAVNLFRDRMVHGWNLRKVPGHLGLPRK